MSKLTNEKKIQIIKAAAKRFDKHGISKTTLNEIARDLRIGKATLYGYFASKEDIFFSVLDWEGAQYLEEVKEVFAKEDLPLRERFLEYFKVKETLPHKYKLMIDSILQVLGDNGLEPELTFVKNLLSSEEELIKSVLIKAKGIKENSLDPSLPVFIVLKSWGLSFSKKLQKNSGTDKTTSFEDILLKTIDYYLL